MRTSSRPSTPEDAETRHIDKKPRLEVEAEGANGVPVQLDAPVDAMLVGPKETKPKTISKKAAKKAERKARLKGKIPPPAPYSTEHILYLDAKELLGDEVIRAVEEESKACTAPFDLHTELELTVSAISSIGVYDCPLRRAGRFTPPSPLPQAQDRVCSSYTMLPVRTRLCTCYFSVS